MKSVLFLAAISLTPVSLSSSADTIIQTNHVIADGSQYSWSSIAPWNAKYILDPLGKKMEVKVWINKDSIIDFTCNGHRAINQRIAAICYTNQDVKWTDALSNAPASGTYELKIK